MRARAAFLAGALALAPCARGAPVTVWRSAESVVTPEEGADEPRGVGSLQKAWLLRAWADAHPDAPLPRFVCTRASRCWLAGGHGSVDLRRATAVSCNAYFRALAADTPRGRITEALRRAGFLAEDALSPDAAIGLDPESVRIAPRALLAAYLSLVKAPWLLHEDARREWLLGMRDAAESGTASRLGARGLLAKTGTVASKETLGTSGWAVTVDPAGTTAALAFLARGTGGDAMAALGTALSADRSWEPAHTGARSTRLSTRPSPASRPEAPPASVRVRLFASLAGRAVRARNDGDSPAAREGPRASWVSPGAEITLQAGDRLAPSTWTLTMPSTGLVRRVSGSLEARRAPSRAGGAVALVLTTTARAYAEGVVRGELGAAEPARAEELAAAVLRFLAKGARHGTEDVCDLSHCARFVGEGPPLAWETPAHARVLPEASPRYAAPFDDAAWARAVEASERAGPSSWTASCGGEPLSERTVWGSGRDTAPACPYHASLEPPWTRELPAADVEAALGRVTALAAAVSDGVHVTRVVTPNGERLLRYDELHRALAARAGWDALPSPPDSWERTARGWRVTGRGSGHRVGVCLGGGGS